MSQATAPSRATGVDMTHRQIMEALSGLLLGMFVAILSSTVVSNALPRIITDLQRRPVRVHLGGHRHPAGDHRHHPALGQARRPDQQEGAGPALPGHLRAGLGAGRALADTEQLIACRVLQGIGAGGLTALAQVIMAAMISPRERGRYSGYLGAVFAVGTVGGPLIGGVIVDTSWLGWRWCFYVGVPFAIVALIVLQKTLHLPVVSRKVKIDWWGAILITAAVSLLLIWVSFAGDKYDWMSWQTAAMVGGALVLGALFDPGRDPGRRADHPAAAVPQPHHHPGRRRQPRRRRRACSAPRSSSASTSSSPRPEPDHVRPDDDADDRRPAGLLHGRRAAHHPHRQAGRATWSPARRCSPPGFAPAGHASAHDTDLLADRRLHGRCSASASA